MYYLVNLIMVICSFFSQLLICVIFWQLGAKKDTVPSNSAKAYTTKVNEAVDDYDFVTVEIETWDPDADLQARIWNTFIRNGSENSDTDDRNISLSLSPQQIARVSRRSPEHAKIDAGASTILFHSADGAIKTKNDHGNIVKQETKLISISPESVHSVQTSDLV